MKILKNHNLHFKLTEGKTIILKCEERFLRPEDYKNMYEELYKQMNAGLMIIPSGYSFVGVYDGTATRGIIENSKKSK